MDSQPLSVNCGVCSSNFTFFHELCRTIDEAAAHPQLLRSDTAETPHFVSRGSVNSQRGPSVSVHQFSISSHQAIEDLLNSLREDMVVCTENMLWGTDDPAADPHCNATCSILNNLIRSTSHLLEKVVDRLALVREQCELFENSLQQQPPPLPQPHQEQRYHQAAPSPPPHMEHARARPRLASSRRPAAPTTSSTTLHDANQQRRFGRSSVSFAPGTYHELAPDTNAMTYEDSLPPSRKRFEDSANETRLYDDAGYPDGNLPAAQASHNHKPLAITTCTSGKCSTVSESKDSSDTVAAAVRACVTKPTAHESNSGSHNGFTGVVGCEHVIRVLEQTLSLPGKFPTLFTGSLRRPWRFVLLYGPPGTGKTLIASAAAAEVGASFMSISASDILSKWIGESERIVREIFQQAKSYDRCVVFLDEIDSLCTARSSDEAESTRRIKTEFLIRMQELANDTSPEAKNVLVIAATNLPWELDSAFQRRFDQKIHIGLPDAATRQAMIEKHLSSKEFKHNVTNDQIQELANVTLDGYSGSDIMNVVRHAVMAPILRLQEATHFKRSVDGASIVDAASGGHYVPCDPDDEGARALTLDKLCSYELEDPIVSFDDFLHGAESYVTSVTPSILQKFEAFGKGK